VAQRIQRGEPIEDFGTEAKAEWPDATRAPRQIAGHANAASPDEIVWVIGVDEKGRSVPGAKTIEFADWWAQISSAFDGLPPAVQHLAVPFESTTISR
jgi:hypothetical protein